MTWLSLIEAAKGPIVAALLAAAGVLTLHAFYRAFASNWPENYFGGTTGVDPVVSRSLSRYLAFRAVPHFLVAYACGVGAHRLDSSRALAVILVWAGYSVTNSIPAIAGALVNGRPRLGLATYRIGGFLASTVAALISLALGDRFDAYVPSGPEVAFAFWIAAATLATGHWARSLMAQRQDSSELLERARREVDESLLLPLRNARHPSPAMLYAIAYAEHLNRPGWVRTLERMVIRRGGTYGIMQMRAERPLTDAQSVSAFIVRLSAYPAVGDDESLEDVRRFFLHHNDDTRFADLAQDFYWLLRGEFQDDDAGDDIPTPGSRLGTPPAVWLGGAAVLGGGALLLRRRMKRIDGTD